MAKKPLTISLSGGAGSGKSITADLLHAFFVAHGIEATLQHAPDAEPLRVDCQHSVTDTLRKNVAITIVDYRI